MLPNCKQSYTNPSLPAQNMSITTGPVYLYSTYCGGGNFHFCPFPIFDLQCTRSSSDFFIQINSCLPNSFLPGNWITVEYNSCYPNSLLPVSLIPVHTFLCTYTMLMYLYRAQICECLIYSISRFFQANFCCVFHLNLAGLSSYILGLFRLFL